MYSFSYLEPVCCSMSGSNCCFLTCIQISQEAESLSHVKLLATLWTIARHTSLSVGFPVKNTRVGSHSFLQGIFLTQGLNLHLLHSRQILYCWTPRQHCVDTKYLVYPFTHWWHLCYFHLLVIVHSAAMNLNVYGGTGQPSQFLLN